MVVVVVQECQDWIWEFSVPHGVDRAGNFVDAKISFCMSAYDVPLTERLFYCIVAFIGHCD